MKHRETLNPHDLQIDLKMIYNLRCDLFKSNAESKKLCFVSKTRPIHCTNHMAMMFIFTLCFTLTFAHTVTGSSGDGVLCLVSDSEYIDQNEQAVNEYYECPDPNGDQSRTVCCVEQSPEEETRHHRNLYDVFKGEDTKHKCCLPPIAVDSVLKVAILKL